MYLPWNERSACQRLVLSFTAEEIVQKNGYLENFL